MTTFTGNCHCGAIAFEVDGEINSGLRFAPGHDIEVVLVLAGGVSP